MKPGALLLAAPLCLAAHGALAFDCAKATKPNEKAICADPAALKADAAMSEAYAHLIATSPPPQKASIEAAQANWLKRRDAACAETKGAALGACLAAESLKRKSFLAAEPVAGPGAPSPMAPWVRFEKGGKMRAEVDFEILKFTAPKSAAERVFNAEAEKALGDVTEPEKDDLNADHFAYEATMTLPYASPRFISAHVEGYADSGGAHPNSWTHDINVVLGSDRVAKLDDLVDAKGAAKVFALCLAAVKAEKKERSSEDDPAELAKQVREATKDLASWSFQADKAVVTYDPYAVGSYAEGGYDCELPYATLRPLAKPSFPLP